MRMFLVLMSLSSLMAWAGEQGLTPDDVARLRSVGDAVMSPDGERIAYTLNVPRRPFLDENGKPWKELHVWDSVRGSKPYITGEVNVDNVSWSPDGKWISFTSKRGKDKESALYVLPYDGGEAQKILSHETGIGNYEWSPDGRQIVFLASDEENKERKKLKDKGFEQEIYEEESLPNRIWIADISGDEPVKTVVPSDGHVKAVSWNPNGKSLAIAKAPTTLVDDGIVKNRAFVIDAKSGQTQMAIKNPGKLGEMKWSPDGSKLALISAADENDPSAGRLFIADVKGNKVDRFFLEDEGDVSTIAWKDANTVVYLWKSGVDTSVRTLNLKKGAAHDELENSGLTFPGLSYGSGKMALVGDSPTHPGEVFLWAEGTAGVKRLTFSNPWLDAVALAPQEVVNYKARDGLDLQGLLIRPLNEKKGERYPLIVVVHGGPESHFNNGWLTSYSRLGQMSAAKGYAVFYPNYRASTGRGVAFSKLDHGRPAMEEFDDIVDGVRYLVEKEKLVDEKKVGVTGGSYGGYATAWCSTALTEHFAAGVMFVGISNKISKAGTSDIPEELFLVHDRHRLWEDWDLFLRQSPIYHVEKARTPLLIMHGKDDTRVHPSQSMELYRHLKTIGQVPVRLVFYPGEGHGNKKAASQYDYSLRTLRWFDHFLKNDGKTLPPKDLDYGFDTSAAGGK